MTAEWLLFPALGVVAGLLAGLLGVGGGLVLVAALAFLLPWQGVPEAQAMHAALATSLASILVTGLSSAGAHHRRGSVLWPTVAWLAPGLLLGGWVGSRIALGLDPAWLRAGVSGYCLLAAGQLLANWPRPQAERSGAPRGPGYSLAGAAIGAVSAWVGIGGGSMTVPLLVSRGVAPVLAIGTSSACGVVIALASVAGYSSAGAVPGMPPGSWGHVYLPAALAVAVTSALCAPLGTRLAHRIGGLALRRVFALFLVVVGAALAGT